MSARLVIPSAAVVVLLAACGSSDDGEPAADPTVPVDTADVTPEPVDDPPVEEEPTVGDRVGDNGFFRLTGPADEIRRSDGVDGTRFRASCDDVTATFTFVDLDGDDGGDVEVEFEPVAPLALDDDDFGLPAVGDVALTVDIGELTYTGTVGFAEYTGYPPPAAEYEISIEGTVVAGDGVEHDLLLDAARDEPCLSALLVDDL